METIKLDYIDVFDGNLSKSIEFSKDLIKEPFNEASLFANMLDGKSMQPLISHKAVLVADLSNKELIDESIYMLYFQDKMWVKKYNKIDKTFVSINPEFSHLVYKEDEVHIVAKVLLTF